MYDVYAQMFATFTFRNAIIVVLYVNCYDLLLWSVCRAVWQVERRQL